MCFSESFWKGSDQGPGRAHRYKGCICIWPANHCTLVSNQLETCVHYNMPPGREVEEGTHNSLQLSEAGDVSQREWMHWLRPVLNGTTLQRWAQTKSPLLSHLTVPRELETVIQVKPLLSAKAPGFCLDNSLLVQRPSQELCGHSGFLPCTQPGP